MTVIDYILNFFRNPVMTNSRQKVVFTVWMLVTALLVAGFAMFSDEYTDPTYIFVTIIVTIWMRNMLIKVWA